MFTLLVDQVGSIPLEMLWEDLDDGKRKLAYQMFEHGSLLCEGRTVVDGNPYETVLGKVFQISKETWRDADSETWNTWDAKLEEEKNFTIHGIHSDDILTEIRVINNEELREFVGYDAPSISVDEYDDRFFKATQTKMGAKVWSRAAAALASEHVTPSARGLAAYLLGQDIWPNGQLNEDQLRRHLSLLISEFKRLSQN